MKFNTKQEMLDWLSADVVGRVVEDDDGDKWISVGKGRWVCPDADMGVSDSVVIHGPESLMAFTIGFRISVHEEGHTVGAGN